MMNIISILLWLPALSARLVLVVLGLVAVPLTKPDHPIWGNNQHPVPPKWYKPDSSEFIRDYFWRALRNPSNNVRYLFTEPDSTDEHLGVANCDQATRNDGQVSCHRFIRSGLFSEFWYMRRVKDKFFEFRIGWKFSGVPGFAPTVQLRLGE